MPSLFLFLALSGSSVARQCFAVISTTTTTTMMTTNDGPALLSIGDLDDDGTMTDGDETDSRGGGWRLV